MKLFRNRVGLSRDRYNSLGFGVSCETYLRGNDRGWWFTSTSVRLGHWHFMAYINPKGWTD